MTTVPPGSVTVADLYREMVGMRSDVVKALTRLEVMEADRTANQRLHDDFESRLRTIETAKAKMYGAGAAISVIVSVAVTWVGVLVQAHH